MPDTPVEQRRDDPYHPDLRAHASRLENEVHEINATMRNLEQIMVPIVLAALLAAYACGLAALAVLK